MLPPGFAVIPVKENAERTVYANSSKPSRPVPSPYGGGLGWGNSLDVTRYMIRTGKLIKHNPADSIE